MNVKDKPNKVSATLKVIVTGEFYDDESTEETLRFIVEQDLEDAGFDIDVTLLKEQKAVEPICQIIFDVPYYFCGSCKTMLNMYAVKAKYCSNCGKSVKWNE